VGWPRPRGEAVAQPGLASVGKGMKLTGGAHMAVM
jgi:hypothetical protein